jgi:hypothetical protein
VDQYCCVTRGMFEVVTAQYIYFVPIVTTSSNIDNNNDTDYYDYNKTILSLLLFLQL